MKRVLIIDDEVRLTEIYMRMFVSQGFIVRVANDAQKATDILIREEVDLIILDLKMPEIDGKVMSEIINEYNPNACIIVNSVYSIEHQRRVIPKALDYYDKADGPSKLIERAESLLVEAV